MPTSQWVRWNSTTHIYELSLDNGGSWSVLPLDGSILNQGTVNTARLGSGVADGTKLLSGDSTWKQVADAQVAGAAAIAWSKISKAGSSLADLATRAIANLSDGANAALLNAQNTFSNTAGQIIQGLIDISGASAGQIKFPGTQNPSGNVNTLDDYEEGTFTPIDASGAGLTFAATTQGAYVKIGRIVFFRSQVIFPATANGAITLIGGLPYQSGSEINFLQVADIIGSTSVIFGDVVVGSTTYELIFQTGTAVINSQLTGASTIVTGFYLAAN